MYHCFRLHRGEDLYESIQRYADAHHIAAGVVLSAVGCVYRWELRDASGVDVQSAHGHGQRARQPPAREPCPP